ncbi:cell filamentation protein Fic [Ochrobactrum cytisi]|nr:cell filamentation protein Fic [Brucella cytisi]
MLAVVQESTIWSTDRIRAIRYLLDQITARIRGELPKIYSRRFAEVFFVNPYYRVSDLVAAGIAKRQSAAVYLKSLTDHGLLEETKAGRENLYIIPALLTLLRDRPTVGVER